MHHYKPNSPSFSSACKIGFERENGRNDAQMHSKAIKIPLYIDQLKHIRQLKYLTDYLLKFFNCFFIFSQLQ